MALTVTALTSDFSATNTNSYTTASVSPSDGALVLLFAFSNLSGAGEVPTVTGGGMTTWDEVGHLYFDGTIGRIYCFRAQEATPGTGTINVGFAVNQGQLLWSVVEVTGAVVGNNGADAIGTPVTTTNTGTSGTLSLAALENTDSIAFGLWGIRASVDVTEGSGFTEIHEQETESRVLQTEYQQNVTTVDASWVSSVVYGGLGFEVKAAAAGGTSILLQVMEHYYT